MALAAVRGPITVDSLTNGLLEICEALDISQPVYCRLLDKEPMTVAERLRAKALLKENE